MWWWSDVSGELGGCDEVVGVRGGLYRVGRGGEGREDDMIHFVVTMTYI